MRIAAIALLLLALGGVLASPPAEAHGGSRVVVGVGFGYPFWGPYWSPWYYPPPYYYGAPVVVRSAPVTYIEQGSSQPVSQPGGSGGNWWYYCETTRGYYPYVKECPAGWLRVQPTPPAPQK
jgi:hypothetical protein